MPPINRQFFTDPDINFVPTLARTLRKIHFCNAGMKYYSSYLLMFVIFCKCKNCVLFASLLFHNELANFASARLLLIVAICFVQVVAQLLKPHLMALLHLTSCLLS